MLLLISLLKCGAEGDASPGDELIGWVALPMEELGEVHAQLHPAPLPLSAAEARNPQAQPHHPPAYSPRSYVFSSRDRRH